MTHPPDIHPGKFSLNVSGVAGFFGGDEAISAIQTIHHYKARKFLGWYNSPGSWNVGKKFGKLAKSPFWDGLFPGANEEPAKLFDLDGKRGPKYVAARSGTVLEHTGHLAYLIMEKSKEELGVLVPGKRKITKLNKVTIIKMPSVFGEPPPQGGLGEALSQGGEVRLKGGEATQQGAQQAKGQPSNVELVYDILPHRGGHALAAILPIAASWITCAMCGWIRDWFCFSMILLGIISNGMFSLVIGLACLKLQGVGTAPTAPPGDGMLMDGDNIVLLLGREKEVATITRGRFILEYNNMVRWRSRKEKMKRSVPGDGTRLPESNRNGDAEEGQSNSDLEQSEEPVRDEYAAIGFFSFLLVAQLLAQLLLIPQGTFTGQIMFLISFAVSWLYNLYLSSIDNEYIQERSILEIFHLEKKHMRTYICRTRTTAAVFTCLMLRPPGIYEESGWKNLGFKPESIICNFIPNDTLVWITWRKKVLDVMRTHNHDGDPVACHNLLQMTNEEKRDFDANNRTLLETLLGDARAAYDLAMREQKWLTAALP
ncbi:hypothetical protein DFJ58DRAFT_758883 [Suillus subalutaceus]|uniref:uncharacterized protein n=1 Tax=Suillus subalutaceus TaxID=48586 RepID=UPI001B875AA1|nr:uncharacterized protein DFJ58DRAFT_758883 [Suillus subalutaceus]KAG1873528.1 hypothetical protein DFJ58DRAFT_758883 [Suillus subalutaceus]